MLNGLQKSLWGIYFHKLDLGSRNGIPNSILKVVVAFVCNVLYTYNVTEPEAITHINKADDSVDTAMGTTTNSCHSIFTSRSCVGGRCEGWPRWEGVVLRRQPINKEMKEAKARV